MRNIIISLCLLQLFLVLSHGISCGAIKSAEVCTAASSQGCTWNGKICSGTIVYACQATSCLYVDSDSLSGVGTHQSPLHSLDEAFLLISGSTHIIVFNSKLDKYFPITQHAYISNPTAIK